MKNAPGGPTVRARRYVYRTAAALLRAHIPNGSEWLDQLDGTEATRRRVVRAVERLADQLAKKGGTP